MNTKLIIDYLSALSRNNNREWHHANKDDYKKASAEFEKLLQELIMQIGAFDSSVLHNRPKDLTFKIVREIKPGNQSFLGGGLFADMFKDVTTMVWDYIV